MEYPKQPREYNGPFVEEQEERDRRKKKFPAAVLACLLIVALLFSGGGSRPGPDGPDKPDGPDVPEPPESTVEVSSLIPRIPDWYDPDTDTTVHFDEDGYGWVFHEAYFARMYWRSEETEVLVDYACSYPQEVKGSWGVSSSQASDYKLYAYEEDGSYRLFFPSVFGTGNPYLRPLSDFPERSIEDIGTEIIYQVKDKTAQEIVLGAWGGMTEPEQDPSPFCVSFIAEEEDLIRVYESDTVACGPGGEYRESVYRFGWTVDEQNWTRVYMQQIDEFYYVITGGDGTYSFRREGDVHAWILIGEEYLLLVFEDFSEPMPLHKYA